MAATAPPGPLVTPTARVAPALATRRTGTAGRGRLMRIGLYVLLALFAVWYLTPVYVLLVTGMKDFTEVSLSRMWALPQRLNFASFAEAFQALAPNFTNSLRLAVPSTIISAILGSLNGYVLAKWKFRGADVIFPLILFGMFIPYQAVLIPLVQFTRTIGLYGSIEGLILVHVIYGIPITTLIFRNYYAGIPNELIEAARIDGANFVNIYRYVLFPISVPGFVVVLIWQFTSAWNDFLFAVTLTTQRNWPMTVALNNLAGSFIVEWNVQMAGALLAALPTLLVFIFFGRYFIRGLLAGSLKG
jgi:glucose/mannose transport system permease protein